MNPKIKILNSISNIFISCFEISQSIKNEIYVHNKFYKEKISNRIKLYDKS